MFDLPSMLGEYLLPLLILVPLAIVVVLVATRNQGDEPWQQRSDRPAPQPWTPPVAAKPGPAPTTAELLPEPLARAAAPVDFVPTSPYLSSLDETVSEVRQLETAQVAAPPQRRRASDALPGPVAPAEGPVPLLVVDDSAVVRAKLSKLLSGAGYAVTLARHGHEALEQINQHWFAMMITDLEMPEMDGFELIAHVSNDIRTENLPIVAITGDEALHAKVHDAKGLYGIFKKPWNDRELLARVEVLTKLRPRA